MPKETIQTLVANTDIYLLDQIIKGRYSPGESILDAGCGEGRNLHWFLKNDFNIYAVDQNKNCINNLQLANPGIPEENLAVASIEKLNFKDNFFDHIISSAVLHFASNHDQFINMVTEMIRVLKPGGTLFIRMTSLRSLEHLIIENQSGVYKLPDGSERYLLTANRLNELMENLKLSFVEPIKTVNVNDVRTMCVLVLRKNEF